MTSPYFTSTVRASKSIALQSLKNGHRRGKKRHVEIKVELTAIKQEDDISSEVKSTVIKQESDISGEVESTVIKQEYDISSEEHWQPDNWKILLDNIKEMRKGRTAVVDSQGCERTADPKEKPEVNLNI